MLYGERAEALVRAALEKRAQWTVTELAKETGLSRQSIYTLQRAIGFELADGRTRPDSNAVGAVCVDLSRRGIVAYETRDPDAVPIVADVAGELRRVAVRGAKTVPRKRAPYDVLAKVGKDGKVTYEPDLERSVTDAGRVPARRQRPS